MAPRMAPSNVTESESVTGIRLECKPEKCSPFDSLEIVNIVNCVQFWEKCFGKLSKLRVEE
jgi:hypothetical protein